MKRKDNSSIEDIKHSDGQHDDGGRLLPQLLLWPQHNKGDAIDDHAHNSNHSTGVSANCARFVRNHSYALWQCQWSKLEYNHRYLSLFTVMPKIHYISLITMCDVCFSVTDYRFYVLYWAIFSLWGSCKKDKDNTLYE